MRPEMKKYTLILLIMTACASPQSGNPTGNGPIATPAPTSGLTYMGICAINPPLLIFQPDIMSTQTWSVGNPPVIEQGLCIPQER